MNVIVATACGSTPATQISASGKGAYEASLTLAARGLAIAWHDIRDGNAEIYLRAVDADGRPEGREIRLTETPDASYEPSLGRLGDEFVVAWYEQTPEGEQTSMLGAWDAEGGRRWVYPFARGSRNPVIRTDTNTIFCAWIQAETDGHEAVWAGRWDAHGAPQGAPARVGPASRNTWNLSAALDDSGAWVVFDAVAGTRTSELFLAHILSSSVRLERLTHDDGQGSKYPDLTIDDEGRAALTWYDTRDGNEEVYLVTATTSTLTGEIDGRARRVTTTPGESIGAYLAWNAGHVGLAWADKIDGQHEVYFQTFDPSGAPRGGAQRITRNDTWSLVPAIRPWRDGFALAWNEYKPASSEIHDGTSEVVLALVK